MRVYERLESYGTEVLTKIEIISTLTGVDMEMLDEMIKEFNSVQSACENALYYKNRLTKRKIQKLSLMGEILKRNANIPMDDKVRINDPATVANLYNNEFKYLDREHFDVIILNTKNQIIKKVNVSKGTLNSSIVHPREVFKEAIKHSANAVILMHNHPSGDPTPSNEDIGLTTRIVDAGRILGIKVLDHIIIGFDRFISLKEKNLMD